MWSRIEHGKLEPPWRGTLCTSTPLRNAMLAQDVWPKPGFQIACCTLVRSFRARVPDNFAYRRCSQGGFAPVGLVCGVLCPVVRCNLTWPLGSSIPSAAELIGPSDGTPTGVMYIINTDKYRMTSKQNTIEEGESLHRVYADPIQ